MRIANPMYDAVFKHLLEDPASAKLIVGAILGEELDAAAMPERYAPVLRRLQLATASPELRHSMLTEDEIVEAWERVHRENLEQQEALAEQQEALVARDATIKAQRAEIEALRRRLGDGG